MGHLLRSSVADGPALRGSAGTASGPLDITLALGWSTWVLVPIAIAAWWATCHVRVQVDGPSMLPTLSPGDRVLVARWPAARAGDVVVARDPERPQRLVVKRVAAVRLSRLVLLGDNPGASHDSRDFGAVTRRAVVGRAWYRYAPAHRAGRIRREPAGRMKADERV